MERQINFMRDRWRPMMAMSYMVICLFDFMIGPVLYNLLQVYTHETPGMWQAITLQGGGLYHLSMGAIVGISAYGRTQEKIVTPTDTPTPTGSDSPKPAGGTVMTTKIIPQPLL